MWLLSPSPRGRISTSDSSVNVCVCVCVCVCVSERVSERETMRDYDIFPQTVRKPVYKFIRTNSTRNT